MKVKSKKKVSTKSKAKALKQGAISGRLSSYQKMKQRYESRIFQLTDDIITLVEEKDFMKTLFTIPKFLRKRE